MEGLIRAATAGQDGVCAFAMLDLLPGLVAYIGPDLTCRYANARHAEWFGLAVDDIVGQPLSALIAPATWAMLHGRMARALSGERVDFEDIVEIGTGRTMIQGSYVPDRGADGIVRGIVSMVSIPSARPDLRARISETQALFDTVFGMAPIGMTLMTPKGRLDRVNRGDGGDARRRGSRAGRPSLRRSDPTPTTSRTACRGSRRRSPPPMAATGSRNAIATPMAGPSMRCWRYRSCATPTAARSIA